MKRRPLRERELESRLNAYCATVRTSPLTGALRRSVEHWHVYAAVTGAAMAMATNASAGVIYSGTLDTTAHINSVQEGGALQHQKIAFPLKNSVGGNIGVAFNISVAQGYYPGDRFGGVGVKGSQVDFLLSNGSVKRLFSGQKVSSGIIPAAQRSQFPFENGFQKGNKPLANRSATTHQTPGHYFYQHTQGWSKSEGFAGFSFKLSGQTDYGWVRLQLSVGSNDLLNGFTVIDWGYATGGVAITAGQGIPTAPEPSTKALMILATGAAGVAALRRRRKNTA